MMNTKKSQMNFAQLMPEDLMDLTMFMITNLTRVPTWCTGSFQSCNCHGYGGYIRIKTLEGWGKKSGRIHSSANQVLFWVNLSNIYEILSTNQDYMTECLAFVPQK